MLEGWPGFLSGFHGYDPGDPNHEAPDLVMMSSRVLRKTLGEALGEVPFWCVPVDVNLLGAMNGRKIKDRMRSQWQYKRNSFEVARNANRLIMTVADQMDRNDFRKDLPSHVIDDVRQEKIIMWLDQAEEFFEMRFSSRGRLNRLVRRILGNP
jgi:hypothetical protein